ncbi:hypothetical protein E3Q22_02101 [Wallemia mellicola]|uniref:Uncharacterized protein n=1 Tax=Wallemia mellicola TaxID=1708541 RepID=A0A4T0U1I7_9BASI|nr:hypothetical protein E3Q24_03040 [Wallemia mellicola]TIB79599.1 hypothetical protein E3Q23_00200 [Wallemia mellicola]TIB80136.1 hypothetical protein E3Q22_02101 [Wallemia mellicola]TIB88305.1 hypothetical protein E3Q21_01040 [Wallemia mellicola]TIB91188.1 hypothetical protein E3Q20_01027 [Wallemia mellicola]
MAQNFRTDTTDEGGYGVNAYGNAFSRSNQAGLDGTGGTLSANSGIPSKPEDGTPQSTSSTELSGLAKEDTHNSSYPGAAHTLSSQGTVDTESSNTLGG